jgi:hypothetical protein
MREVCGWSVLGKPLLAQIGSTEWTRTVTEAFEVVGLREDKSAREVVREEF